MPDSVPGQGVPKPKGRGGIEKWIAVLIVIVILAVSGIMLLQGPETPHSENNYTTYTEEQIELIVENNYHHMRGQMLNRSGALTTCLALTERNIGICDFLGSKDGIKECERNYNLILSYQNKCEELVTIEGSWTDFESGFCEKLNSLSCDGLTVNTELLCRYLVENNTDLCIELPEGNYEGCSDYLNLYNAVNNMDNVYCDRVINHYNKILCISMLAGNCSDSIDRLAKDLVYFDLSEKFSNLTLCNKINYDFVKNFCKEGRSFREIFFI